MNDAERDATADLAEIFGLLGDPGRIRILLALRGGPRSVSQLAAAAGLSPPAASHAMRLLRGHRIVSVTREGRHAHYELADAHVRELLDVATAHLGHSTLDHTPDCEPAE